MHTPKHGLRSRTILVTGLTTLLGLSTATGTIQAESMAFDTSQAQRSALGQHDWAPTPEQAALWQEIQDARQTNIKHLQSILESTAEALNQDSAQAPDIALLTRTTETSVDELIGEMRQNRDRYLTLYAQLPPRQQAAVREDLARDLDRLSQLLNLLALLR